MYVTHSAKLTAAEVAALWTQYMTQSAGLCVHTYMLGFIQDPDIKAVFEYAISLGTQHVEKIKGFLTAEGFPVPVGFTSQDVTLNAPRLFSDVLCLHYLNIMSVHGTHGYSGAVTTCSRNDIRDYYTHSLAESAELLNRTNDVLIEKGIYFRPPTLVPPERPDFVKEKNFIAGWFGDKRPLSCIEITDIYFILNKNIMAKAMATAFSQVAHSKKVRDFLLSAIKVRDTHIHVFNDVLNSEGLPSAPTLDTEITDSTVSPFSDKLLMFLSGALSASTFVYYGIGLTSSPRSDLSPKYTSAITDDLKIGADWMNLMIQNGWLEQPPLAENRKDLAMMKK